MSTTTTRLGLYKPDSAGTEFVNVVTDLNNNLDSLDAKVGAFACTSGTRPASPFNGQFIRETDTGKLYVCSNTVGPVWSQLMFGSGSYDTDILIGAANKLRLNNVTDVSLASTGHAFQIGLDSAANLRMDNNEIMAANNGAAASLHVQPDGGDLTFNNNTPGGTLTAKMNASITGTLNVTGTSTFGDVAVSGNLGIGSARFRPVLSSATTVANTTSESALATFNIPANDPVVGAVYRIKAWGTASVAAATTPTMQFRGRIGGVGGVQMALFAAVTIRSGMADGQWFVEFMVSCASTGATGTWAPMLQGQHNFLTSSTTYTPLGPAVAAPVTRDTTVSNDMVITGQWSAASASNTITCRGFAAERVA